MAGRGVAGTLISGHFVGWDSLQQCVVITQGVMGRRSIVHPWSSLWAALPLFSSSNADVSATEKRQEKRQDEARPTKVSRCLLCS